MKYFYIESYALEMSSNFFLFVGSEDRNQKNHNSLNAMKFGLLLLGAKNATRVYWSAVTHVLSLFII